MDLPELPELEQTLGDIVLELLRAPNVYPELVLSAALDGVGEFSSNAVRITHHYTDALMSYGYAQEHEELQKAMQWFSTPFPDGSRNVIDQDEMNRLEALLRLNPYDPFVKARLERLVTQRDAYGRFDIRVGGPNFGTLLAVKVLVMAERQHMGVVDAKDLKQYANALVTNDHRDKDLALALRLRHELFGGLTVQQRKLLHQLLEKAAQRGGAWDVRDDIMWAVEQMRDGHLTVGEVADYHASFREIIVSTCYVIENLAPLVRDYPEIEPAVRTALGMWWRMFNGKDALDKLHVLFPMPYDYLLVLCRTLVAVKSLYCCYTTQTLMQRCGAYVLRRLAQQQNSDVPQVTDGENIKRALRQWLLIELSDKPQSLKLGVSGADVVRVKPDIRSPLDENARLSLPDSLVIKSGSFAAIELERENYLSLPNALRSSFVRIPRPSYIDRKKRRAYVIMSDLHNYWTLYEAIRDPMPLPTTLSRELSDFLINMHRGGAGMKRVIQPGLLRELYLLPMQSYIGQIFSYLTENDLLSPQEMQRAMLAQDLLYDLVGTLVRKPLRFEEFPTAYMHGDLHSRNIMIKRSARNGYHNDRLEFKLIDLEKLRRDGDPAMDLGELLADLEILLSELKQRPNYDPVMKLAAGIERAYGRFAKERDDTMFAERLHLARAWALLRFAKGNTKRGMLWLLQRRTRQARNTAHEVLDFANRAVDHLQQVIEVM